MVTVSSPLMGKELAKFAYLFVVTNRRDSPTAHTALAEKMMRASAMSRRYALAKTGYTDPKIGAVPS